MLPIVMGSQWMPFCPFDVSYFSMLCRVFLLLLVLICHPVHAMSAFAGVVTHVTDGDTLWIKPDAGGPVRKLRIEGIDAPEICQPGGAVARAALARRVQRQHVQVALRAHDVYGRGVARIQLHGRDLGGELVRAGQAWSYRWGRHAGPYASEEKAAQQARLGVFASRDPESPRDFRKRHGSCYRPR